MNIYIYIYIYIYMQFKMSDKFKKINKNRTHYCFDDMVNIKNLDPSKIKIDEKSHKNI